MIEEDLKCIGCGATIQTTDEGKSGYTPASSLKNEGELYCKRCFRLRHYNEVADTELSEDDFLAMLNEISTKDALIVNVIDIFDFSGSLITGLQRFAGGNPVLIIGNKADILPKSLKKNKLLNWMKRELADNGIKPVDVMLTSQREKGDDLEVILDRIEELREGRDVYVVGVTNVGKSTFINRILKQVGDMENVITTSHYAGTTLNMIEIELSDGAKLVDTPGIIHKNQIVHLLDKKDLKLTSPSKEIKPKAFQLNPEQTLFLGGLARFDFIKGERQSFYAYFANELDIHRTKLAGADEFYEKHKGGLLKPAVEPELVRHTYTIKEPTDVVINGLGWIAVKHEAQIAIYAPKGVGITLRKALI
jgi:ribosome biogenesis GTPase YqeH